MIRRVQLGSARSPRRRRHRRPRRPSATATCGGRTAARSGWSTTAARRCTRSPSGSPGCSSTRTPSTPTRSRRWRRSSREVVGWTADLLHAPPTAAGLHDHRRHRDHPVRGEGRPRAGPRRARHHRAGDGRAGQRPRRLPQGGPLLRHRGAQGAGARRLAADVDAMAAAVATEHRARRRLGAAVPAGRGRPDPGDRRARRRPSAPTSTSTRAWAASCCRSSSSSAATCRRGTSASTASHDLRRPPQARLRAEGRVGDPAPHQGAAPLPDLRVRRLARRLLRLAQPAGHTVGAADGDRVGRDAPPRHRGLPRLTRRTLDDRRPHGRRHPRHRRPRVLGDRRLHVVAMAADPGSTDRSTCSRSATRWPRAGWYHDRQTPTRLAALDRERRQRRRRSTSTSPTWPSAWPRSAAPASPTAPPTTPPWSDHASGYRRRPLLRHPDPTDRRHAQGDGRRRGRRRAAAPRPRGHRAVRRGRRAARPRGGAVPADRHDVQPHRRRHPRAPGRRRRHGAPRARAALGDRRHRRRRRRRRRHRARRARHLHGR